MMELIDQPSNDAPLRLASLFHRDCFITVPRNTDKFAALRQLVNSLVDADCLCQCATEPTLSELGTRERLASTALGRGLAIPHLRTRLVHRFTGAVGVSHQGIDFAALDGKPTRLIILVLSPFEQREQHGHILRRLATLFNDPTLQLSLQRPYPWLQQTLQERLDWDEA